MSAWYVVYTQPGAEMLAQGELEKQGFEVYCPRYSRDVRHARSVKRAILTLFPHDTFRPHRFNLPTLASDQWNTECLIHHNNEW